ncbi:hypothetical protein [Larkinella rosea]|uniref:Uncharacterized protein n=1 Tax=Larkinella rosea TaxID=2025312 RepID=A0A3P1C2J3_9BACT|nr:hypothetical protein [Larkinella rosea]RRB07502.1 hypothetical protein EHT25_06900 [Larkinella rosea]
MKALVYCWLLISLFSFRKHPKVAPKAPSTGITSVTWIGFGQQTSSLPIPAGTTTLTASSLPYPKKIEFQNLFYQEVIKVDPAFKPGNPIKQPPTKGNWFVRRQALMIKDGKTQVLQTSKLTINKNAEASNPADQIVPAATTHLEYQLGRTEKMIDKSKPGKFPKTTTIEVYPSEAIRIAVPVGTVLASACSVKTGVIRPLPCEFQMIKFQILGKSGTVLYETTQVENGPVIKLPFTDCKKQEGPFLIYDARWIVKRVHKPNYPVNKGYLIGWGQSGSDFNAEVDAHGPVITGLQLDETLGKEFTLSFEVKKPAPESGVATQMGELILENDVTITKFPPTQMPGATRAEAYIRLKWTNF